MTATTILLAARRQQQFGPPPGHFRGTGPWPLAKQRDSTPIRSRKWAGLAQAFIALPFLTLGAWCVAAPGSVEALSLSPEHYAGTSASRLLIGCFGAQAILSGVFAATTRFQRLTFLAYGIVLLPFFWFNYYFWAVEPIFGSLMALDFGANILMLAACMTGWWAMGAPASGLRGIQAQ